MKFNKQILNLTLVVVILTLIGCGKDKEAIVENIPKNLSELQIDNKISSFLIDLKDGNFKICYKSDCLPSKKQDDIFNYLKKWAADSLHNRTWDPKHFTHIYTFDPDKWSSGCVITDNEPRNLIEYIILTDNKLGLGYKSGGIVTSSWFTVFEVNEKGIFNHWTINRYSETFPDLIGELTDSNTEILK